MDVTLPSPAADRVDITAQFLDYLDAYRRIILDRVSGLDAGQQRASRLPSGWSPLELVKHVYFVERRWLHWGFAGESVADPWGDQVDGRWTLTDQDTLDTLAARWVDLGERSRAVVEAARLDGLAVPGERFGGGTATLSSILFHLVQEFARHAGHLDVARELIDGVVGEDAPVPIGPPARSDALLHIAQPQDWVAAQADGVYRVSTRGRTLAEEGFIHAAFPDQVVEVAGRYYADLPEVVLLHLDPQALGAEVRVAPATAPGGPRYPHIHGEIPLTAVRVAEVWRRDPDGAWRRPG